MLPFQPVKGHAQLAPCLVHLHAVMHTQISHQMQHRAEQVVTHELYNVYFSVLVPAWQRQYLRSTCQFPFSHVQISHLVLYVLDIQSRAQYISTAAS